MELVLIDRKDLRAKTGRYKAVATIKDEPHRIGQDTMNLDIAIDRCRKVRIIRSDVRPEDVQVYDEFERPMIADKYELVAATG